MTHQQAVSTFASERYLLDEMSEPERSTFEEHYFSCAECAEDMRLGALMRAGARAGLIEDASPARLATPRASVSRTGQPAWYRSAALPWALAASLAMVAGYETFIQAPALRHDQVEALVLAPVTLRPASRGQEPTVSIGLNVSVVTFAVDVSSAVGDRELTYDLRTASGLEVASGHARVPASGPLLLLVPARSIAAAGHYVLTAADAEYRFGVVTP